MNTTELDVSVPMHTGAGETTVPQPTFKSLIKTASEEILRDKKIMWLELAAVTTLAAFIGGGYWNTGNQERYVTDTFGLIYFMNIFTTIFGLFPTVVTLPVQLDKFKHRNYVVKSTMAYYLARMAIDNVFLIQACAVFSLLIYVLTSQPLDRAPLFLFFCTMPALISYSLAILIAVELKFKSNGFRIIIALASVLPLICVAGFWTKISFIPFLFLWMEYLNYVHFAYEGAVISVYGFERLKLQCENEEFYSCRYQRTIDVLQNREINPYYAPIDGIALIFIFMGLHILTSILVYWRARQQDQRSAT